MANRKAFNSIDAMLSGKLVSQRSYPDDIYNFPEFVQRNLISFYEVFSVPSGAIPTKRQKKNFTIWLEDIIEVERLCGTEKRVRKAYEIAKEKYQEYSKEYQFILWRPMGEGMRKLIIAAIMQINEEEKQEELIAETIEEKVEVATIEQKQQALRDLKSMLKKDDK